MGRSIVVFVTVTKMQEVTAVLKHSGTSAYTQPAEYQIIRYGNPIVLI